MLSTDSVKHVTLSTDSVKACDAEYCRYKPHDNKHYGCKEDCTLTPEQGVGRSAGQRAGDSGAPPGS